MIKLDKKVIDKKFLPILAEVRDPELPFLSVLDLGLIHECYEREEADGKFSVNLSIRPTYSACPANVLIQESLKKAFYRLGHLRVHLKVVFHPIWTTEDISQEGRRKLLENGIAPPLSKDEERDIACPFCHSKKTMLLSEYGSTSCKSIYKCRTCEQAFDYFKCFPRKSLKELRV